MARVVPTKLNLINAREFLKLARDGRNLLDEKKEILITNILSVIKELKKVRAEFDQLTREIYNEFIYIKSILGDEFIYNELKCANIREVEFDIIYKNVIGVIVPVVKSMNVKMNTSVNNSVFFSSYRLESLKGKFEIFLKKMIEVSEKETVLWNLIKDLKKTQRRVNALDNVIIPEILEDIKFIVDSLEDRDREVIFQLQRIKGRKTREELVDEEY
ncbi:MAG: V-type ATP synthase subunit D [Spirochaetia bacterium]|nr:V-type ATP synthase subunit D [Spirochaetota bacterium]MCX8097309.1 V-type ATP synthase subunit D [Spirochaetota bacterium]MDW8112842.1 V-type ATP synthase subunit D [Spirochaetia bacterium]